MISEDMKKEWTRELVEYINSVGIGSHSLVINEESITEINIGVQSKIKELMDKGCPRFIVVVKINGTIIEFDIQGVIIFEDYISPLDEWLTQESLADLSLIDM